MIDAAAFRQVLGHYPTGVAAITAYEGDHAKNDQGRAAPVGMVVGTFTSVSLDPPLVGFLPDKSSTSWPKVEAAGHFCVNVLAADQGALCRQLAGKGDKFAGVDLSRSLHGLPVLAGVIAAIECRIHAVVDAGDHWFVLGRVLAMDVMRTDADPMLFFKGKYGGFAGLN
jgi:flavin reductase (DIM6/NTAB) family NADH-FMN oxidoreductase RutF